MAIAWTSQRSGIYDRTSDNVDSPWHDGGAQTALAAYPSTALGATSVTIATGHAVASPSVTVNIGAAPVVIADGAGTSLAFSNAFTCGTITLSGIGEFGTGATAALACTSITTTAAKAGVVTIGASGATLAGVLNNAGTGLLTINGAITGATNVTTGNCTMNANVTMNGTLVGPAATQTLAQAASTTLSGFTANVASYAGAWTVGAGATISANSASARTITIGSGGSMTVNGTAGAGVVNITNAGAGGMTVVVQGGTFTASYYTIETALSNTAATVVSNYGQHGIAAGAAAPILMNINHLYCPSGIATNVGLGTYLTGIRNVAIGYLRDGSASAPATGIGDANNLYLTNCIINATTQVATLTGRFSVVVDNLGHLDTAMLPGTGSALDLAVVDAGISKTWLNTGTTERSVANPRNGTYHVRLTPSNVVTKTVTLDCPIRIPIASGNNVAVTCYASRSADTDDCAKIVLDPSAAWYTTATSAQTLTNTATYYALTASGAVARGTGAKGKLDIVLRVDEYTASAYVDFDTFTAVIT